MDAAVSETHRSDNMLLECPQATIMGEVADIATGIRADILRDKEDCFDSCYSRHRAFAKTARAVSRTWRSYHRHNAHASSEETSRRN